MKATLKNYRQSPRKVRLLADLVRGKSVKEALTILSFADKRAAEPFAKVIESAKANAENQAVDTNNLVVSDARVDKGITFKRFMPRARGGASRINKRNSHITVTLASKKSSKTS